VAGAAPVLTGDRASRRERRLMQIPAFTADAAVYRSSSPYHAAVGAGWEGRIVAQQVGLEVLPITPLCLPPCPPEGGGSQTCCIWVRQFPGGPVVRHCWTVQCPTPDPCETSCSRFHPRGSCSYQRCICTCNDGVPVCCDGSDPEMCPVRDPNCPACGFVCT